jgi:hypothetical protein
LPRAPTGAPLVGTVETGPVGRCDQRWRHLAAADHNGQHYADQCGLQHQHHRLDGDAAEDTVAHQAFANAVSEVFAVVGLGNTRGVATARRVGMEWVGETDKYYGLTLQIYRLTAPDLDYPEPTAGVHRY